jgi:hypothetical protein
LRELSSVWCLTGDGVVPRVADAPSTELPRLMAPRVASASAQVSREAGRGSHRLGAFLVGSVRDRRSAKRQAVPSSLTGSSYAANGTRTDLDRALQPYGSDGWLDVRRPELGRIEIR